jgi:hypothetical protein
MVTLQVSFHRAMPSNGNDENGNHQQIACKRDNFKISLFLGFSRLNCHLGGIGRFGVGFVPKPRETRVRPIRASLDVS